MYRKMLPTQCYYSILNSYISFICLTYSLAFILCWTPYLCMFAYTQSYAIITKIDTSGITANTKWAFTLIQKYTTYIIFFLFPRDFGKWMIF